MMATHSSNSLKLVDLLHGFVDPSQIVDQEIYGLSLDSRNVVPGDCFIALNGTTDNGARFAPDAIAAGANAVLTEDDDIEIATAVPVVRVPKLSTVVGHIANRFYNAPSESIAVIAVTGTNGKTTIAQLCAQALKVMQGSAGYVGTLGHGILGELEQSRNTTPDPITLQCAFSQMRERQCRSASIEVSSHAIVQSRVVGTSIDVGVFTNLGHDHLDYHGSVSNYAEVKMSLFHYSGISHAIVNIDDPVGRRILLDLPSTVTAWTYGDKAAAIEVNSKRHFSLRNVRLLVAERVLEIDTPHGSVEVQTLLRGEFNLQNTIAALAALTALGEDISATAAALSQATGVPGRMQHVDGGNGSAPLVIVDYAHTPESLSLVLTALSKETDGRLTCVFGCGGDRDKSKRAPMGQAAEKGANRIIVTSDNPRGESIQQIADDILCGVEDSRNFEAIHDRAEAIELAITTAHRGDVVLIAGKGHETYQIIGDERNKFSDFDVARKVLTETFK